MSGRSPLAGLSQLERPTLYLLGLLSAVKGLALVGIATAVSTGVVGVIENTTDWSFVISLGLVSALARAFVTWGHRVVSARAALGTKERLRERLADAALESRAGGSGSVTTLATQGLDGLDDYFTLYLPALVTAVTVPLIIGARILFADWVSAVVIVLTVPLIPVFMTLIGLHTQRKVAEATSALGTLSDHLVELARGLPVLVGLGRASEQVDALRHVSERHRARTVETLRTAFLSSLALELIATISVAIVAVFIGVRLVNGDLSLETGLLVLVLAPECMTPFRDIGAAFHSSQDGREALLRARAIIDAPAPRSVALAPAPVVGVRDLSLRFDTRTGPILSHLDFSARAGQITLLDGSSGGGKSSVLAILAGRLRQTEGVHIEGTVVGVEDGRIAWMPQHPHPVADTVLDEVLLYAGGSEIAAAAASATLERIGLDHLADADPRLISPGELRRLAFARILARVDSGADVVLLDEPTAQLDAASAETVIDEIRSLRLVATVIVASHDSAVRDIADTVVMIGEGGGGVAALRAEGAGIRRGARDDEVAAVGHPLSELGRFLRPIRGRMFAAIALATFSALFAVALTAVSGWLIVRASEHPPIMYLLVAIVGVRFFGIGRAVLRYSERLVSHDAVFAGATGLTMRLWTALSQRGLRDRRLLSSGSTVDRLVRDVTLVRDLAIRVIVPAAVGVATMLVAVVALWMLAPGSLPLTISLAVLALVVAPVVAVLADRASARAEHADRSLATRRLSSLLDAADELRANSVDGEVRAQLRRLDDRAGVSSRRGSRAAGLGSAIVVAACGGAAIVALLVASAGGIRPGIVAVLALVPLALIDPLLGVVSAAQLAPGLVGVLSRVSTTMDAPLPRVRQTSTRPIDSISLHGIAARWVESGEPVIEAVSAELRRGQWLVVSGPSGSGKSTLLSVLLGHLDPIAGRYTINGADAIGAVPLDRFGWCPQDGHLFDSTLRANLLIARPREEAPDDAELREVLDRVGLGDLLERLPLGLDTRIGSDGSSLSGGERQRVAVARTLLTRADVILIDEPTAHLDDEAATALMADLRRSLRDRITVLVTHQSVGLSDSDERISLGVMPRAQSRAGVGGAA